jgi:hypothetical protein
MAIVLVVLDGDDTVRVTMDAIYQELVDLLFVGIQHWKLIAILTSMLACEVDLRHKIKKFLRVTAD